MSKSYLNMSYIGQSGGGAECQRVRHKTKPRAVNCGVKDKKRVKDTTDRFK